MSEDNKTKIIGYTKEKIYDLLPAVYRQRDTKEGKQFDAMIEIIAEQVAVLEKNIGGLYDNWFIETCDEWVTSYIADMVGAKSLSASKLSSLSTTESVSQRAYIANTISYRRRKGTLSMLEQLARDITQWNAKAVEFFQLLSTTQNINHIRLANHRTPDLKGMSRLDLLNTPFDTIAHTVEVRRISSGRGYYNIQNIGIFLWRLQAFPSINTHAYKIDEKNFTFNPFGYEVPIFNLPVTETLSSHLAEELNIPAPIRRRALYDNLEKYYGDNSSIFLTVKYVGDTKWQKISVRDILVCNLLKSCIPDNDKVAIDPEIGKITFSKNVQDVVINYYYGFSGKIGGGFYSRPENDSDFSSKPNRIYKISKKQAFVWNKILFADEDECSHLREMLKTDFSITWINESLRFENSSDKKITMSDGNNSLSLLLENDNTTVNLDSDNVHVVFDARKDQDDIIYIYFKSINEALNWWKNNINTNTILEIIDSEVYNEDLKINLPADSTLSIKAKQETRPIILGSLEIQGEKDSHLILDGLWIDNQTNNPAVMINPGDMKSITLQHCTLVPGNDPTDKKIGINIQPICTLDMITSKNYESENLAEFLNSKFHLGWINKDAVFKKKKDPNEKLFNKECYVLKVNKNYLKINLARTETSESSAVLSKKIDDNTWEKIYEFSVFTEEGKRILYPKDSNDGLKITLDHAISSRINTSASDAELTVTDSIIDGKSEKAISCHSATIQNTTIFGKTKVDKLTLASNTIFTDTVETKITQQGCVRFSYIPPNSKTPRRYMCIPKEISDNPKSTKIHPHFTSQKYGDPGYGQLHKKVDKEIFEGADNGAEMGAFNHLYQPQRLADLKSNLNEYMRFKLEAGVFLVT